MLRLRPQGALNGTFAGRPLVRLPVLLLIYLAAWLAAELAVFSIVVHAIGFSGAVFGCVLTSFLGLAILRRLGLSAAVRLRQAVSRKASAPAGLSKEALLDGTLEGVGGILLILPGFVSDLFGLALAAPSFRAWIAERLRLGSRYAAGPALIELEPREWSRHEGPGVRD
jgi:UPF0716 protein FxsA